MPVGVGPGGKIHRQGIAVFIRGHIGRRHRGRRHPPVFEQGLRRDHNGRRIVDRIDRDVEGLGRTGGVVRRHAGRAAIVRQCHRRRAVGIIRRRVAQVAAGQIDRWGGREEGLAGRRDLDVEGQHLPALVRRTRRDRRGKAGHRLVAGILGDRLVPVRIGRKRKARPRIDRQDGRRTRHLLGGVAHHHLELRPVIRQRRGIKGIGRARRPGDILPIALPLIAQRAAARRRRREARRRGRRHRYIRRLRRDYHRFQHPDKDRHGVTAANSRCYRYVGKLGTADEACVWLESDLGACVTANDRRGANRSSRAAAHFGHAEHARGAIDRMACAVVREHINVDQRVLRGERLVLRRRHLCLRRHGRGQPGEAGDGDQGGRARPAAAGRRGAFRPEISARSVHG